MFCLGWVSKIGTSWLFFTLWNFPKSFHAFANDNCVCQYLVLWLFICVKSYCPSRCSPRNVAQIIMIARVFFEIIEEELGSVFSRCARSVKMLPKASSYFDVLVFGVQTFCAGFQMRTDSSDCFIAQTYSGFQDIHFYIQPQLTKSRSPLSWYLFRPYSRFCFLRRNRLSVFRNLVHLCSELALSLFSSEIFQVHCYSKKHRRRFL